MFKSTRNKGFQMTFANGWTVSVQFGPFNYCEVRSVGDMDAPLNTEVWECPDAEVAAWDSTGKWYDFECDSRKGYMTPNEVLDFMDMVSSF